MTNLLRRTIAAVRPVNETARRVAAYRQGVLTKPRGSLGRLEEIAVDVAGIMSTPVPSPEPCALVLAAGDHGVSDEGVSAYPKQVTAQMLHNFLSGGAAINAIAGSVGVAIHLVDAGVDGPPVEHPSLHNRKISLGTQNLALRPAMSELQAVQIVESGIEFVGRLHEQGFGSMAVGDMGIGNTTSAAAITAMITASPVERVTGRGTMVDDEQYRRKIAVVRNALSRRDANANDGVSVLAAVGGYETGFLAGCMLGAASHRLPVILDGFPTAAAALIACALCGDLKRYCIAGHASVEPGHRVAMDYLGLKPLLALDMRLGEGTGAALAFPIVRAACRCLSDMATFTEAAVDGEKG